MATLNSEVDLSSSPQARSAILGCLNGGKSLLVDLSAVDYIDSSGIASLVEGFRLVRDKHLAFGLLAVSEPALRVLQLARLDKVFRAAHLPVTIQVRRFTADGLLRERAMLYSEDGGHRVLKQHAYHYWMDAPASLMHDYWTARLPGASPTPVGQTVTGDFVLYGRLRRMERLLGNERVDIALSLEFRLRDTTTGREFLQRSYDVIQRASSDRVLDSVKAFETALRTIHARFVIDLAALPSQASRVNSEPERVSYDFQAS